MKMYGQRWIVVLALLGTLTYTVSASAKTDEVPRRMVGGHHFTPSLLVDFPAIVSHVGSFIGAGYAQIKFTDQNTGGTSNLKFAAIGLGLGAQIAFADFIGLRFALNGSVLSGINADSALNVGAMFNLDVTAGPVFRVFKLGPVQMIGGIDVGFNLLNQITPASIAGAALGGGSALTQEKGLAVRPYLAWAIGVGKIFGLQAGFDYAFNRNFSSKTNGHEIGVAALASFDFWVLGLHVGYGYRRDLEAKSNAHKIEAALFYSGRGNMSVGLALVADIPKKDYVTIIGQFALIYYWK